MRYDEFQAAVSDAGLSIRGFARLLKLNPNSITNCKQRKEVPDHLGVIALLIRELVQHGIDYLPAIEHAGVQHKAPRGSGRLAFAKPMK